MTDERNDATPEAQAPETTKQPTRRSELAPNQFTWGYKPDGTLTIDGVEVDKISNSRVEVIEEPELPEEVQERLREAEEIKAKYAEVEPLAHIKDREDFKQWIQERVEYGDFADPNPPPIVTPEDIVGTQQRRTAPEFEAIRLAMTEYAETLSDRDAELLRTNHKIFNETYDRFKAGYKGPVPGQKPVGAPLSWNAGDLPKSIQSKEVLKGQAWVEPPGGVPPPPPDPDKKLADEAEYWRKRAYSNPNLTPTQKGDAELKYVQARMELARSAREKRERRR